ncbi:hypothetical protein KC853_01915 [Candidatus Saccharibacteria bacterium]|nr:hypothetical protein [Candidatus Saccharibacteria bacterium]MCB9834793.1 hypothetical protein [Candidatus Nomurabacteria bacterium]
MKSKPKHLPEAVHPDRFYYRRVLAIVMIIAMIAVVAMISWAYGKNSSDQDNPKTTLGFQSTNQILLG